MKCIVGPVALALVLAVLAVACRAGGSGGEPSPASAPTLSSDVTIAPGSAIALVARTAQGRPNVYVIDADSGAMRQVTQSEDFDWWPTWSPDGQRLAFISWMAEESEEEDGPFPEGLTERRLVVANADGSQQETIAHDAIVQQYMGSLSWSHDGSRIVYMAAVDLAERPQRSRLRVIDVASGSEVPLSEERLGFLPAWSPDGAKIAFGAFVGSLDERGKGESEIFVMDGDGGNLRRLSDRPGPDLSSTWSSDNRRIVWWGHDAPTDSPSQTPALRIFMAELDTGRVAELGEGSDPVWSPDGRHIAFVRQREPQQGVVQAIPDVDIFVQDVETGETLQLTENAGTNLWPTWSPDGRRIAFVTRRDHLAGEIYVMNADGSDVRRLTDNLLEEGMLAWSPSLGFAP